MLAVVAGNGFGLVVGIVAAGLLTVDSGGVSRVAAGLSVLAGLGSTLGLARVPGGGRDFGAGSFREPGVAEGLGRDVADEGGTSGPPSLEGGPVRIAAGGILDRTAGVRGRVTEASRVGVAVVLLVGEMAGAGSLPVTGTALEVGRGSLIAPGRGRADGLTGVVFLRSGDAVFTDTGGRPEISGRVILPAGRFAAAFCSFKVFGVGAVVFVVGAVDAPGGSKVRPLADLAEVVGVRIARGSDFAAFCRAAFSSSFLMTESRLVRCPCAVAGSTVASRINATPGSHARTGARDRDKTSFFMVWYSKTPIRPCHAA